MFGNPLGLVNRIQSAGKQVTRHAVHALLWLHLVWLDLLWLHLLWLHLLWLHLLWQVTQHVVHGIEQREIAELGKVTLTLTLTLALALTLTLSLNPNPNPNQGRPRRRGRSGWPRRVLR